MNREIKFRVWDESEYKWKYPVWDITNDLNKNRQKYILSQFTGLKDKNGKEIYEGDIVDFYIPNLIIPSFVEFDNNNGGWVVKNNNQLTYDTFRLESNSFVIIGNIYENPELLKNE